jgi:asparagine synthase (glutamine-hydrolysing)
MTAMLCRITRDLTYGVADPAPSALRQMTVGEMPAATLSAGVSGAKTAPDPDAPWHAAYGRLIGYGIARIHNRKELTACISQAATPADDLALLLAFLDRGLSSVVGEFAFVAWDPEKRVAALARDPSGAYPLYYTERGGELLASSSASTIADGADYNLECLGDVLIDGFASAPLTAFAGVWEVEPGTVITVGGRSKERSVFWRPENLPETHVRSIDDAVDGFRERLTQALVAYHSHTATTWAALSGGVDSSTIVCFAEHLAMQGTIGSRLGGTVSLYDEIGRADERVFSNSVVNKYGVRNDQLRLGRPWEGFGDGTPLPPHPRMDYLYRGSHDRVAATIAAAGGRYYLSGLGPDHYLAESSLPVADMMRHGRGLQAARLAFEIAVAKRDSVARVLSRGLAQAIAPSHWRSGALAPRPAIPAWLDPQLVYDYIARKRTRLEAHRDQPRRSLYDAHVATRFGHLASILHPDTLGPSVVTRHPYLFRPLVEFVLGLSYEWRFRPGLSKYVLRQSGAHIVPDMVRMRRTKGSTGARAWWSLQYRGSVLQELATRPILADLGCVDTQRFARRVRHTIDGRGQHQTGVLIAAAAETWLRVREGRWQEMFVNLDDTVGMPSNDRCAGSSTIMV